MSYLFRLPEYGGGGGDGGYGGGGVGGGDGGGVPPRRCFTKISNMIERPRYDLHGALERNPHHPKTCHKESIVDKFHE